MFCPKCGSRNTEDTKFCRGCGADVSNVLAVVDGRPAHSPALAEKQIELFSSGLRGLIVGGGLVATAVVAIALSMRLAVLVPFVLAFASYFLGVGVSRVFQARAIKRLRESASPLPASLSAARPDYIEPIKSLYETEDLAPMPRSVTEHTTTHLKRDPDDE